MVKKATAAAATSAAASKSASAAAKVKGQGTGQDQGRKKRRHRLPKGAVEGKNTNQDVSFISLSTNEKEDMDT